MSYEDVSQLIEQQMVQPAVKTDPELRLWCLAQKGYTDIEINVASAKQAWLEARTLAHSLHEREWETRAEGELGIISFLEGDSKHAAAMVGDAFASEIASGDTGGQVRSLEMLGNGFNEVQRYHARFTRQVRSRSFQFKERANGPALLMVGRVS